VFYGNRLIVPVGSADWWRGERLGFYCGTTLKIPLALAA